MALRLVEALCLGLSLPSHALHPILHNCHSSFMRFNYYPPPGRHHSSITCSAGTLAPGRRACIM